jgi:hypothetical protein
VKTKNLKIPIARDRLPHSCPKLGSFLFGCKRDGDLLSRANCLLDQCSALHAFLTPSAPQQPPPLSTREPSLPFYRSRAVYRLIVPAFGAMLQAAGYWADGDLGSREVDSIRRPSDG